MSVREWLPSERHGGPGGWLGSPESSEPSEDAQKEGGPIWEPNSSKPTLLTGTSGGRP